MTLGRSSELDALLARLPSLDHGDLLALAGARGVEDREREGAWKTVRQMVSADHLERELDLVRSEVGAWATRLGPLTVQQLGSAASNESMVDARRDAAPAVLDAAAAYLVGAKLPDRDRASLLRPWVSAIAG